MADDEVNPLSLPTTYYGWAKPTVGGDTDAWGGMLNTDLDGIDTVVHGIDIRPVAMGDNRIINGNFAINQRVQVSGTAIGAGSYGHDRWKAGASGCTYTFTAGLPDTTVTITAGTLTQVIEAGMIEGGVYTLSWTGAAQARVYQGTPTGAYAAGPLTTASLLAGVNAIVEFNAGTLTRVKLEIGSVATPFNRQSLAKSMADCQRYYQIGMLYLYLGNMGGNFQTAVNLSGAMRAAPTLVKLSDTSSNISGLTLNYANGIVYNSGFVAATGAAGVNCTFSASAEL